MKELNISRDSLTNFKTGLNFFFIDKKIREITRLRKKSVKIKSYKSKYTFLKKSIKNMSAKKSVCNSPRKDTYSSITAGSRQGSLAKNTTAKKTVCNSPRGDTYSSITAGSRQGSLAKDTTAKKTFGAQLNPEAPIFEVSELKPVMSVKPTMVVRPLTKLIANPFEEIISFKLLYYEARIEINKKDEEIQRLREIIENKYL